MRPGMCVWGSLGTIFAGASLAIHLANPNPSPKEAYFIGLLGGIGGCHIGLAVSEAIYPNDKKR